MPVPIKTADEKIADLKVFIPNARKAIEQFEALLSRLESEEAFRSLWETDSAKALEAVNRAGLGNLDRVVSGVSA
jgi:hypothetical protein